MRENVDQNNSEYEHYLRSVKYFGWDIFIGYLIARYFKNVFECYKEVYFDG